MSHSTSSLRRLLTTAGAFLAAGLLVTGCTGNTPDTAQAETGGGTEAVLVVPLRGGAGARP